MQLKKFLKSPEFFIFLIILSLWSISIFFSLQLLKIFSTVFSLLFLLFIFLKFLKFLLKNSFLNGLVLLPFQNLKRKFFFKIKNKFFILFLLATIIPAIIYGVLFYSVIYFSSGFLGSHIFRMEVERVEHNLSLLNSGLEREILLKNIEDEDDYQIFLHKFLKEHDFEISGIFSAFYTVSGDRIKIVFYNKPFLKKFYRNLDISKKYLNGNLKGVYFVKNLPIIMVHSPIRRNGKRFYLDSFVPLTEGFVGSISKENLIFFQPVLIDAKNNLYVNDGKDLFRLKKIDKRVLEEKIKVFSHSGGLDLKFSFFKFIRGVELKKGKEINIVDGKRCVVFISGYLSDVLKMLFSSEFKIFLYLLFFIFSFLVIIAVFSVYKGVSLAVDITKSFDKLYQGTLEIQKGNLDFRIEENGYDQIAELSKNFNLMAENISKLLVEVSESEKLKKEMELARNVQKKFFPRNFPEVKHIDIYGKCIPAEIVSGDFYNFFRGENRIDFFVGDISGKGFPASLLMASVNSALLTQPYKGGELWKLIRRLNRFLYEITDPQRFSTLFYMRYYPEKSEIEYVNCGHNTPFLLRNNLFIPLTTGSTILGMFEEIEIETEKIEFLSGDVVFIYTDGVVEATDNSGKEFGIERLKKIFVELKEKNSREIVEETLLKVKSFHKGNIEDDQTILVIKKE